LYHDNYDGAPTKNEVVAWPINVEKPSIRGDLGFDIPKSAEVKQIYAQNGIKKPAIGLLGCEDYSGNLMVY